ncbi:SDR family NAD(P)-dependent oxidoreductase [Palleronia sp. LCG004]|uniref:SDR family NAD(P)-dependent oxidoreductase n=1 Tax=Palleronia sp. LCG004 TaxID=3079304 RepID=UPI0029437C9A|nr:SDR family NAD(P)-dependent oxidoreductase [Palleronia sp. LCG004]WOI56667.1 SDR family NAD(P)-dependent oxidoreductase [Palleronia sp. LCG004]
MARSILITGCSSGIGLDAAMTLSLRGWRVFATCRDDDTSTRLAASGVTPVNMEMSDADSIARGLSDVLSQTDGTLDALYSNAAFACPGAVEDLPTDALRAVFETNVFGLHELTRRVIPVMRAQGHGRIVQCSSVLGYVPMRWRGAYVASKFALEGLTDTLRLEMRDTPIKVVTLQPGPIASRIRANSIPHFERWIDWKASPRRAQYEATLLKRLYDPPGTDRFQLPASAATRTLIRALEAENPRPYYRVTTPARLMAFARRILPSRALDALLARG